MTRVGEQTFDVPQVRGGGFYPSALDKGTRTERALNVALAEMYVQGVSTRKVVTVLQALLGPEVAISSTQVSRAAEQLDAGLAAWRERPLGETPYVLLDARYERIREGGRLIDCAVLVATGITADGKRRVLGVSVAFSEAEVHWRSFLESLVLRGLRGVKFIVSDDHAGLKAARRATLPSVPWQRCQFHLQQNAQAYVTRLDQRKPVAQRIRAIFNAPDKAEAERLLKQAVGIWTKEAPKLAAWAEENLPRILSTTQIGVTIASLAIGALAEDALGPAIAGWLGGLPMAMEVGVRVAVGTAVALIVVTYFTVVLAELMPRGISLGNPEGMAAWLTPPLLLFAWFTAPFSWLLNRSSQLGLRLLGLELPRGEENVHSAEELRILVEQSQEKGVLLPQDAHLIEGVFEFSEKNAREVMTPRTDLDALPVDATLDDALAMVEETHRSRYPVYEDTIDNVIGLVLAKDLIPVLHHPPAEFSLRAVMRPVHVVPGSREVEEVLADFKPGVVTMEDLLEEIVGEILDEYDEPPPPETTLEGDTTLVPGNMNIGEFNERFALAVPEADYTTIAGFVFGALGRLPVVGDRVTAHGATFTVKQLDGRRIETLAVKVAAGSAPRQAAG
ncbi:MAG: hypothetical protein B7Z72_03620 [Gemmatimonadetes bacterium 21-71-4]|nr:MAG: hypothetical protein B7Z72_03620 [Gemmatimonadetes bacterium 21-71-4]